MHLNTTRFDPDDGMATGKASPFVISTLPPAEHTTTVETVLHRIATALERIADHLAPLPADVVGSGYVAQRLNCSTVWVAEMARRGDIPRNCIVAGTGNGKLWKFYREKIDQWLATR